ncbi:MAG: hypothetical protein KH295_08740 [Clostridiaceae bacterium]|nr:hypothetical protein [uncultured Agathobaculum sp.]MBS6641124.1 hypothetical protein [Clostridiaceae bacterium]HIX11186.1 hypothetical protein [Candidatus Agathobaculum pullistercoris]
MSKRLRKLRRENKRALEPLSTASTVLIDNITDYIRSAPVRPFNQELARRDMIRMLADAEARGEPPEAVIGADYRLMCDEIISAFPPPSGRYQLLALLRDVAFALAVLLLTPALRAFDGWPVLTVDTGLVSFTAALFFVLLSIIVLLYRRPYVSSILSNRRALALCILGLWYEDVLDLFFHDAFRTVLFRLPAAPVIALTVVFFGVYGLLYATLD